LPRAVNHSRPVKMTDDNHQPPTDGTFVFDSAPVKGQKQI
jgi:hypothetical protein